MRQKFIICACGHKNDVPVDWHESVLMCTKCHGRLPVLNRSERSVNAPSSFSGSRGSLSRRRIGELLLEQSIITADQLSEALRVQTKRGSKIVETLISLGYLDVKTFMNFLARQPGIASIDLGGYEVPSHLVSLLPREFAVKHEVFPIDKMGRHLTVGMVCPLDAASIAQLEEMTGLKVKALLCLSGDIHAAIARYYPAMEEKEPGEYVPGQHDAPSREVVPDQKLQRVETALTLSSIGNLVKEITSLPPLPATVQRVREAMGSPDVSVKDVVNVVSLDPPIAAKLLSLANSPAYGFASRVTSVHAAVSLLGLRETYSVVLAASAEDFFKESHGFNHQAFWDTARFCAMASVFISQFCGVPRKTGIFAAGLLHDIGRLVLARIAPERFVKIDASLRWENLLEAEHVEFHMGHPEVGALLSEHWGLPPEITEAIRFHHDPASGQASAQTIAPVSLANLFADYCSEQYCEEPEFLEATAPILNILGVSPDALPGLHASLLGMMRDE